MLAAGTAQDGSKSISFWQAFFMPSTIKRGIKVGLLVGTVLLLVNQHVILFSGHLPPLWEIILTYLVPYSVSSHATAANISEQSKQ